MAACTSCEPGSFPFSYLGLPIGSNMSRSVSWQVLMDRFKARMSGWKANLLSICGRLTLIKSVLGSLGIYYLSIFKVPEMVVKSLESLRVAFFWGGHEDTKKIAWVKWSNILASLDKGGLGVGNLKAFNKDLLLKWRWRLFQNLNTLWVHLVKAIHGEQACVDLRGSQTNGVWASIVGTINRLYSSGIVPLNSIRFKVGDGSSIRFGKDTWPITMGRMKTEFDNLILDIASLETDEIVGFDSCIWNLSNDDTFSANKVMKHIHDLLSSSTCWYKMILKKKKQSLVFKVDFEKAYDSVRWDFLNDILGKFGFGDKGRMWIQSCLKSSRGSIIINGSPTKEFQFFKGLKQGDPLSPFPFILIMKSLHLSFQRVEEVKMFKGIKIGPTVTLSHMYYADDAVFVGKWCKSNITTLVHVLDCFHRASSLRINMRKSKILGVHVESDRVKEAALRLGGGTG
nr:RNA-directed DNA polymerase, eukaryota, reverse transcriptase zinc-binding domain protein [Tanacetum cinerariifolium]